MTYNVFGGTLNLAQCMVVVCVVNLRCARLVLGLVTVCGFGGCVSTIWVFNCLINYPGKLSLAIPPV